MNSSGGIAATFRKRTVLEKVLFFLVLSLALCLIGLAIFTASNKAKNGSKVLQSTCATDSCKILGSAVFRSLDKSVDPCKDFYKYACGGWEKSHTIPEDMGSYGSFQILYNKVFEDLYGLLTDRNSHSSSLAVENALKFYDSCMDTESIEKRGNDPILKLLTDTIGGWPVIDNQWNGKNFDYLSAMAKIQLYTGSGLVIVTTITPDPLDTSNYILVLEAPSIDSSEDILLKKKKRNPIKKKLSQEELDYFKRFFIKVATFLGGKDEGSLSKEFDDINQFETALTEFVTPGLENNFTLYYNKMTIKDLQSKNPQINWLRYLQELTNSSLQRFGVLTENDQIIVTDLNYFSKLSNFVKFTNVRWNRMMASYLGWNVIMKIRQYMPHKFQEAFQDFLRDSGIPLATPELWKTCTTTTTALFSNTMSFLYVKKYFPVEAKNEIMKLVLDLKFQLEMTLANNTWMDKLTKHAALAKLLAMKNNIGYPDWMYDVEAITDYYVTSGKPNMTNKVFDDYLALTLHNTMDAIQNLRIRSKYPKWPMDPITINAAYNPNANDITIPAAFLQMPMYNPTVPRFYNYAAIGSIIGHEMTHGFDNEGKKRNANGVMENWWSENSEKEFQERAKCFVEQYNRYGVNGPLTLGENIADNGGLRQAYSAYVRWKNNTLDVLSLPNLEDFTIDQQFFLVYGSIWCTIYEPELYNTTILSDVHSPSPYRVAGTTANLPEFSEAFQCSKTEEPKKRCSIW